MSLAIVCTSALRDAVIVAALGGSLGNLSVALAATAEGPATHYGCSLAAEPEGLRAACEAMGATCGDAFDALLADLALVRVLPPGLPPWVLAAMGGG